MTAILRMAECSYCLDKLNLGPQRVLVTEDVYIEINKIYTQSFLLLRNKQYLED